MEGKKTLIVFYSRNGNTKIVMEKLAEELKCDIEELADYKKRNGIIGYIRCGFEASRMKLPEIKPVKYNPGSYDIVIIGTPTWASNMASPVRTYITRNKDSFKNIAIVATALSTGHEMTIKKVQELCGKKSAASLGITRKEIENGQLKAKTEGFIKGLRI